MDWQQWRAVMELGGLTDEGGRLGRQVLSPDELLVPDHVVIEGDRLVWRTQQNPLDQMTPPFKPTFIRADGPILDQFVKLADAPPSAVLLFARRWGVFDRLEDKDPRLEDEDPSGEALDGGAEPLALWYDLARQASTILRIAGQLNQGERPSMEEWRIVLTVGVVSKFMRRMLEICESRDYVPDSEIAQYFLVNLVNGWLRHGDVRPQLSWDDDKAPEIVLEGHALMGALAVQLLGAVSRTGGITACSNCGAPYMPTRQPRAGNNRYCPDCGRRAAVRDAARRHRQRKRAETTTEGVPPV